MNVEALPNYGKDILTIQREAKTPLAKKLSLIPPALRLLGGLVGGLGVGGTIRFVKTFKAELARAAQLDWSDLRARGISEDDLNGIIRKIVVAKVMADLLGMERAAALRRQLSRSISYTVLGEVFAPTRALSECGQGDFLAGFKPYYTALSKAMEEKGLEASVVVEDTPDTFQINVVYCAWAEAAKKLGNVNYCYYSTCYGDEVFFPRYCGEVGVRFSRTGTLGMGNAACDHRFVKVK